MKTPNEFTLQFLQRVAKDGNFCVLCLRVCNTGGWAVLRNQVYQNKQAVQIAYCVCVRCMKNWSREALGDLMEQRHWAFEGWQ